MNASNTLLLLGILGGGLLLVQGQVDQANARAVDGFSNAVVQTGELQTRCSIKVLRDLAVSSSHAGLLKSLKEGPFTPNGAS